MICHGTDRDGHVCIHGLNWCMFLCQDMENKIRNTLNEIYFGKTKDIVNGLRSIVPAAELKQRDNLMVGLNEAIKSRTQQQAN